MVVTTTRFYAGGCHNHPGRPADRPDVSGWRCRGGTGRGGAARQGTGRRAAGCDGTAAAHSQDQKIRRLPTTMSAGSAQAAATGSSHATGLFRECLVRRTPGMPSRTTTASR